ncbi:uncharacterized protein LOC110893404 [Helianthus annuus]|uniref:uncharacterized protein LOC110893404 n=1 Tax=Helianthus annuus TaxID=4232 RepID=UPI000B8FCDAE|nr:uncharacterized protein LOC110893404 [Helianthus annuus]
MEDNCDSSLEDLGFQSFSERMHADVFITSKGSLNVQDLRQTPSLFSKPIRIDGNPVVPARGVVQKEPKIINIIDELQKVTVPVPPATSSSNIHNNQHGQPTKSVSYAEKVQATVNKREVNFRLMKPLETREDADLVIPKEVVQQVQDKFENVLYGYFLGTRLPFPVVEYYAKNVWAKFGCQKIMMNSDGFFFFKFDSRDGLLKVLEGGPWLIRKIPIFLSLWSPKVSLKKEGVKTIPLWVKLHNVPISVYTDDGLSLLASKLGVPKRLDSYTADMCVENWGRSSYARAMIEVNADEELKDHITIAIPKMDEEGYIMERVKVDKVIRDKAKQVVVDEEGFVTDRRRMAKQGFPQKKPKPKFMYKPKVNKDAPSTSGTKTDGCSNSGHPTVKVSNPFQALANDKDDGVPGYGNDSARKDGGAGKVSTVHEEVLESVPTEMSKYMGSNLDGSKSEGASTPGSMGFNGWNWTSNGNLCQRGTRIILGWNPDDVDLMVLYQSDQVVHTQVRLKAESKDFFCSFVYAENRYQERRALWEDLCSHSIVAKEHPWVVLGDFNSALNMEDCLHGPSSHTIGMREFYDCIQVAEITDINHHGCHFTWNQKPKEGIGVFKKLDRVMGNIKFMDLFPNAYAKFQPPRVSDHSPCILNLPNIIHAKPKPFKFANFLTSKAEFKHLVAAEWAKEINGFAMFSVVKKMRNLKPCFRKLLHQQGNLHDKVARLRSELDICQKQVDVNPHDPVARDAAAKCLHEFQEAAYDEECFLKQKSKVEWLCAGDSNTAFFHNSVKSRNARNKILCISDVHGNVFEGSEVPAALVDHYSNFLGNEQPVQSLNEYDLFVNTLSNDMATHMVRQVTRDEIKKAMFSIGENKAPGPDGFTSAFFKNAWDIVGDEVTKAVLDFFDNGKLLKQVNHTIIALIPKKDTPNSVLDYRPISCCNVLFKCVSKIITDRLKGSLNRLVSINQSAFIPGRKITDNILLTQELMHNYHLNRGPPRCAFKIDIQKAYDTVSWQFLDFILHGFGFHHKMVNWIMTCVSTVSYSLSINGEIHGYFAGKRGLRQGDPMSPYLFTLVMEVEHSSSQVWHSIRRRAEEVDWVKFVWFPQCIPKHAFFMWLVMRRKLLTQDKILQWDFARRKKMNMMCCLLCYANVDSHDHLFFDCNYATQVWIKVRDKGGMSSVGPDWNAIIDWLGARANSKSAINFISRLLVAAAVYFVWQERNARLFKNQTRPPDALANLILQTVRYKLVGVKFKECQRVRRLLEAWEIYNNLDDKGG